MSLKQEIAAQLERNTVATIAIVQKHINQLLSGLSGLAAEAGDAPAATPAAKAKSGKTAKAPAAPKAKAKGRKAKTPPHVNVDLAYELSRLVAGLPAVGVAKIAEALGKSTTELERPVAIALERGWVTKSGERRSTVYHPGSLPSSRPADALPPAPKAEAAPASNGGIPAPVAGVPGTTHAAPPAAAPAT